MGALWGEEGEMWRGRDPHLEILNLNELNNNIENVRLFKIYIDDVFSRICIFYLIKCIDLQNLEKTKNDMIEIFQKFIVSIKK